MAPCAEVERPLGDGPLGRPKPSRRRATYQTRTRVPRTSPPTQVATAVSTESAPASASRPFTVTLQGG